MNDFQLSHLLSPRLTVRCRMNPLSKSLAVDLVDDVPKVKKFSLLVRRHLMTVLVGFVATQAMTSSEQ